MTVSNITNANNAAHNLQGLTLSSGWHIIEKIDKTDDSTGSFFSVCYKVQKGEDICFLKAFNFAAFLNVSDGLGRDVVDIMKDMVDAYIYERELSNMCREQHITKVVFVRDAGQEIVNGFTLNIVPYLIFDLADGDLRSRIDFSKQLDYAWRLKSLHSVAVGLQQLHHIEVSHQDLKPSNILVFKEGDTKIGDIGRALCKKLDAPHSKQDFAGDYTYAPPEFMYGYFEKDWYKRVFATDSYLLGSMIVFYFTGISMTALLAKHLPDNFKFGVWRGPFKDIEPYILVAFSSALSEFEASFEDKTLGNELTMLVEQLCFPNPDERGHRRNLELNGNQYDLERFVTRLNVLTKKVEFGILNKAQN